ncbi:MAG TPA: hypothetical protein DEB56_14775 [Thiobacillus sp.]|nr:hypothetical protein [Thiobacillus sp.]
MHVYSDNDCVWVVAESKLDACKAYAEFCGYEDVAEATEECGDGFDPSNWSELPDDSPLSIVEDEDDLPCADAFRTMTCAEWVAEQGRGFLCTTER